MITETEFTLARSCPTKIKHQLANLPRNDRDNNFADWLNSESQKIKHVAGHLFPVHKKIIGSTPDDKAAKTKIALTSDGVVAGAVFTDFDSSCRVDFTERDGPILRLYAVVTKCVTADRLNLGEEFTYNSGVVRTEWRDALELLAYRVILAQKTFPELRVIPLIIASVRGSICNHEGLHSYCSPTATHKDELAIAAATELVKVICVDKPCLTLRNVVERRLTEIRSELASPTPPILGYRCKKCEFRGTGGESGFEKCWGALSDVKPHMFTLNYMWFIQDENGRPVADRLAREGKVSMWDIPENRIIGEHAPRQLLQMDGTESGREIIDDVLLSEMNAVPYPRHFLDIETIRSILPVHSGGKVNGLTLFQYSIHTQASHDSAYVHKSWLNNEPGEPNIRFLKSLREALGDTGSVLVWTGYEEASFNELFTELVLTFSKNEDLEWLRHLLSSGRIIDMHEMCFKHYWHPKMEGRTSIKCILPAVWSDDPPIKYNSLFADFPAGLDPYSVLSAAGTVSDGCGAMVAYLDVMSTDTTTSLRAYEELLRYCCVDTLAMVFIWEYWAWRLGNSMPVNPPIAT